MTWRKRLALSITSAIGMVGVIGLFIAGVRWLSVNVDPKVGLAVLISSCALVGLTAIFYFIIFPSENTTSYNF